MTDESAKCFVASRTDGLGERLRGLINAMILAEHFGVEYKFIWPERGAGSQQHHAIVRARATFNRTFLGLHHIEKITPEEYPPLTGRLQPPAEIRALLASPVKGIAVTQEPIDRLIDLRELKNLRGKYRRAFYRIRFTKEALLAVESATIVPLPRNAVAVHLRAGDIIYGSFRMSSAATHKAACYPVVKQLIMRLKAEGKNPIIFGQDQTVCRLLADKFGLVLATDIVTYDDQLCAALSEIVVMSRCDEIYAGASGFSILAGLIGDKKRQSPAGEQTPQEVIDCIAGDKELDDPASPLPALQRAYAYYMIAYVGIDAVADDIVVAALGQALDYDPINAFYAVNKANLEARAGNLTAAEATLKQAIDADDLAVFDQTSLYQVIRRTIYTNRLKERLAIPPCLDNLTGYATPDYPFITYVAALTAYLRRQPAEAARFAAQAVAGNSDTVRFRHLLDLCPAVKTVAVT